MEVFKFTLSGEFAFFKVPNFNYNYLTFSHIPKPTLLGIFGAICGYEGYWYLDEDIRAIPEYLKAFEGIKIGIVPREFNFYKSLCKFNNSSGTAYNTKRISNLITTFQLLEKVSWDIYVKCNNSRAYTTLKNNLMEKRCVYIPYLGNNSYLADISGVEVLIGENNDINEFKCESLVETDVIEMKDYDGMLASLMKLNKTYKYQLPVKMDDDLLYVYSNFLLTDDFIIIKKGFENRFLYVDNRIVYFY